MAATVCPGERLRFAEEFVAGRGTYVRDEHVVAAVVGEARVVPAAEDAVDRRPVVEVLRRRSGVGGGDGGDGSEQVGGTLIPMVRSPVLLGEERRARGMTRRPPGTAQQLPTRASP